MYFNACECCEYLVHTGTCVVQQLLNHPKNKYTKTAVAKCAHSKQICMHTYTNVLVHLNGFSLLLCPPYVPLK